MKNYTHHNMINQCGGRLFNPNSTGVNSNVYSAAFHTGGPCFVTKSGEPLENKRGQHRLIKQGVGELRNWDFVFV